MEFLLNIPAISVLESQLGPKARYNEQSVNICTANKIPAPINSL